MCMFVVVVEVHRRTEKLKETDSRPETFTPLNVKDLIIVYMEDVGMPQRNKVTPLFQIRCCLLMFKSSNCI